MKTSLVSLSFCALVFTACGTSTSKSRGSSSAPVQATEKEQRGDSKNADSSARDMKAFIALSEATTELDKLKADIVAINEARKVYEETYASKEFVSEEVKKEREAREADMAKLQSQIDAMKADNEKIWGEIKNLNPVADAMKAFLKEHEGKFTASEAGDSVKRAEFEALVLKVEELKVLIEERPEEKSKARKIIDDIKYGFDTALDIGNAFLPFLKQFGVDLPGLAGE